MAELELIATPEARAKVSKQLREQGLTLHQIAERLHVSYPTVYRDLYPHYRYSRRIPKKAGNAGRYQAQQIAQNDVRLRSMLTINQIAERTGESYHAWRTRLLRGELPYYRIGNQFKSNHVRVDLRDLEEWLDEQRVSAVEYPNRGV